MKHFYICQKVVKKISFLPNSRSSHVRQMSLSLVCSWFWCRLDQEKQKWNSRSEAGGHNVVGLVWVSMHVGLRKARVKLSISSRWLVWAGRRLDGDWEGRRGRILCSSPGESKAQTVREAPRRPRGEGAEFEAENEENTIHSLWVFGFVGPPCRDAKSGFVANLKIDLRPQIQLFYFYAFGMEIYMVGLFHLF